MAVGLTCCKEKRAFFVAESCDVIGDYQRYKVVDFQATDLCNVYSHSRFMIPRPSRASPESSGDDFFFFFFYKMRVGGAQLLCLPCLCMSNPMRSEMSG